MAEHLTFATLVVSAMSELTHPFRLLPRRIAVTCHDAGGANIVLALLGHLDTKWHELSVFMQGPAEKLCRQRFPNIRLANSASDALANAEVLLSSTGWASDVEHDARRLASQAGVRSIAVLDHWVNYAERFEREGQTVLPDEIWVCDREAMQIARGIFPFSTLVQVPNFYLEEQIRLLPAVTGLADELLYVLEPIRSEWGRSTPGEFQALDFFSEQLALIAAQPNMLIRLRPHPSDPPGKYDEWISTHSHLHVKLDDSVNLNAALASANRVAGCESFAMAVALAAGRQVYCTLPPWAPPCRLPHKDLIHLKDLRK
ncbi:hypothetical protein [Herbaspirillum robiniae]|uniref:Capsule polysaccharide biosynthesis protein n=1 Tax=Herbaspirillum robiniae TaxID=2014887 RepID=A0ABX2M4L4_9BURK|nr:hypothetical protein [Herbaspirillum robiniae]NUU03192.1 hypothetical protein [Herbaspirillum robiniae]